MKIVLKSMVIYEKYIEINTKVLEVQLNPWKYLEKALKLLKYMKLHKINRNTWKINKSPWKYIEKTIKLIEIQKI